MARNWTLHDGDSTRSGLAYRVLDEGKLTGPWLLLLHGFSDDSLDRLAFLWICRICRCCLLEGPIIEPEPAGHGGFPRFLVM